MKLLSEFYGLRGQVLWRIFLMRWVLYIVFMLSSLKLTTLTFIGREEEKKLTQILTYLMELPDSAQFVNPVDWQQLELHDYPLIVKNPMHLSRVQEKLKSRQYRSVEEVLDHIQLIWDNCKAYNPEGHYFVMADKMERNFKKMIRNYLPNIQVVVPKPVNAQTTLPPQPMPIPAITPTLTQKQAPQRLPPRPSHAPIVHPPKEEQGDSKESGGQEEVLQSQKNRLHQRLKQLTQQDLGSIIYMIQEHCSEGYRDMGKDMGAGRGQILLDCIDPETFRKLNHGMDEMLEGDKITGSKKVKI